MSLNSLHGAKALTSSPSPKNLIAGVNLVWSMALVCTLCADDLVFPRSKADTC